MEKLEYLYKAPYHTVNLNEMRLKDKWCDVTIKVNKRQIRAHKIILAANLKYFDTMFSNDSFQESQEGIITMESVEETDLEEFVCYAYTGKILLTESNAFNFLKLANYFGEDGIMQACIEFLKKHLRKEEACPIYKFADTIHSLTLKNAAKASIINNIGYCSRSSDYLTFDSKSLTDILFKGKEQTVRSQKLIFEGTMRWIMHAAKDRKIFMKDLLSFIDITTLKSDDLIEYIHKNLTNSKDEYYLIQDIISYYQTSKSNQRKEYRALIVVNGDPNNSSFQFFDFKTDEWSLVDTISDTTLHFLPCSATVLNDELYFIKRVGNVNYLQVCDPMKNQITTLHSFSNIVRSPTLCADSSFLYICGGINGSHLSSNQAFRYNLETHSLETLIPMTARRFFPAAIFYQGCLYVLGGHNGYPLTSVEKYDPALKKWIVLSMMSEPRHSHAAAVLDGKIYVCGGIVSNDRPISDLLRKSVEVYDPEKNSWQQVARMNKVRDNFTAVAYEGKLLALGGDTGQTVEVYDPQTNQWHMNKELSSGLLKGGITSGLISASCLADIDNYFLR